MMESYGLTGGLSKQMACALICDSAWYPMKIDADQPFCDTIGKKTIFYYTAWKNWKIRDFLHPQY